MFQTENLTYLENGFMFMARMTDLEHLYFVSTTMYDGAVAGFKYFHMGEAEKIKIEICGNAKGVMQISDQKDFAHIDGEIIIEGTGRQAEEFSGLAIKSTNQMQ